MMTEKQIKMLKDYQEMIKGELFDDLEKDMPECACDYRRHKMLASIIRTIKDIDCLTGEEWESMGVSDKAHALTPEEEKMWVAHMENSDGTTGAHWTMDQTTAVAKQYGIMFDHIDEADFYTALNMIYSDYGKTLTDAGISDVGVFVKLAKDFLFDEDAVSPKEKLHCYYKYIVKK